MDMWEQFHRNRKSVEDYYKTLQIPFPGFGEFWEVYSERFLLGEKCSLKANALGCKLFTQSGSYTMAYHPSQVVGGRIGWYRYKPDDDDE